MNTRATTLAALAATLLMPVTLFAAEDAAAADAKATATPTAAKADRYCEPTAQSRIRKSKALGCNGAQPTRSYSRDDLQSTGQFDSAEALRRLDPRFQ